MTTSQQGQCLCGKVTFNAVPSSNHTEACHCSSCRKWTGGVLFSVVCDQLHINNEEELGTYRSSEWGERVFCKTCGTHLFWRMLDGSMNVVMLQAFDQPEQFDFTTEVFIDSKPANYSFANDTQKITGEAFMAMYAAPDS